MLTTPAILYMKRPSCQLLRQCTTLKQLQQSHAQAITQGLIPNLQPLSCKLLNAYAALGAVPAALAVFRLIPHPDLVTLTSLISLHLNTNRPLQAISVFSAILTSPLRPDGFAAVGALSASTRIGNPRIGRSIHALIYRLELPSETIISNALIDMYCRTGRIRTASTVFDQMPVKDAVSWSTMLHGYVKCDGLESAGTFFGKMPRRDAVSWTVMITGHVQGKRPVRALELFRSMMAEGCRPTLITIVGVLSACADVGALDVGHAIHGYINKINVISDVTVYNALIDMYSKSGNLVMAKKIFDGVLYKDVYTWTTMVSGFAVHGDGRRAIEVFSEMLSSGVRPNEVTFLAVLTACGHAGLVDEGKKWFDEMEKVYGFEPQLVHYGCMVDLLGRAGLLREAKKFIDEMGTSPDCVMWRSLLSASLCHGNLELAEIAGNEIIKQEPDDDGVYVLLWNMYASSNKWGAALEMRKKMRDRKVVKKPGCSSIEVNGLVHEFLVDDKTHSSHGEIYQILEEMTKHFERDSCSTFIGEDDEAF